MHDLAINVEFIESLRAAFPEPLLTRAAIPYLAAWITATKLVPLPSRSVTRLQRRQEIDLIAGWWLAQQPEAQISDCDAIVAWRAPVDTISNPVKYLRLGFGLGYLSLDELRAVFGLPDPTEVN